MMGGREVPMCLVRFEKRYSVLKRPLWTLEWLTDIVAILIFIPNSPYDMYRRASIEGPRAIFDF